MSVLTLGERRVLANLAIPQNVEKVTQELRADQHAFVVEGRGDDRVRRNRTEQEVHELLQRFQEEGWALRIKENRDPAHVAAHLPKRARQMEDEQANIYATRLASPRHQWRMEGDLWVITEDGIQTLKEPDDEEPLPMEPSRVQAAIWTEWGRTLKGVTTESYPNDPDDPGAVPLLDKLLEDEFLSWAKAVADDCERRWGKQNRPTLPLAGGAGWTDVFENRILDHENQKTAMPALVAPWFMCLVILALTDTDTPTTARDGSHIPTYTGYAEKSVAAADMPAASAGSAANTTGIVYAACTAGSSTILGFGNKETNAATGDLRKYGTTASTLVNTSQTPPTFSVGAYVTTAD